MKSEVPSFTGELNREAGEDVGTYAINQNTVELADNAATGFKASNYTLEYVAGTLTITQATSEEELVATPYDEV